MASLNQNEKISRALEFIVIPSLVLSLIMTVTVPNQTRGGFVLTTVSLYALFIFIQKRFKEELIGLDRFSPLSILIGLGLAVGFVLLTTISPTFALLTPSISFAVSDTINGLLIIILAPLVEESFRSATIALLRDIYKWKTTTIIIIQAIIFAIFHVLAYGVIITQYQSFSELSGALTLISGSILAAFLFGITSGTMMIRFKNMLPSLVMHMVINFWILRAGLIIIS